MRALILLKHAEAEFEVDGSSMITPFHQPKALTHLQKSPPLKTLGF